MKRIIGPTITLEELARLCRPSPATTPPNYNPICWDCSQEGRTVRVNSFAFDQGRTVIIESTINGRLVEVIYGLCHAHSDRRHGHITEEG